MKGLTKQEQDDRNELLSAYLDHQLSAEERARLERELAQDSALRRELEALRETVNLVQDLPQAELPRNFILPERTPQRHPPEPEAHLTSDRPRAWLAPLLTAATTIVSLLFVVVLAGDLLLAGLGQTAALPERTEPNVLGVEVADTEVVEEPAVQVATPPGRIATPGDEIGERGEESVPDADEELPQRPPRPTPTRPVGMEGGAEPTEAPDDKAEAATTAEPPAEQESQAANGELTMEAERARDTGEPDERRPTPTQAVAIAPPAEEGRSAPEEEETYVVESPRQATRRFLLRVAEIGLGGATLILVFVTLRAWRARRR